MINVGFIYAIGAAIIWGLVYVIDQKILHEFSPFAFLFIASLLTTIAMLPFIFWQSNSIKTFLGLGKINLLLIILVVILAICANFLILSGIKSLGSSRASIIEISYPFFVVLFSFIFFRSELNIYFFIGGILIFLGSIMIVGLT